MAMTVKLAKCVNYARSVKKGEAKKDAGKRSGLKRSAKKALVVTKNLTIKGKMPKCLHYKRCGRLAKGPYASFCMRCFVANARLKGSGSSGNSSASGNPGNAGNSSGNSGNAGNSSASGNPGSQ